jgi:hypothetical protein
MIKIVVFIDRLMYYYIDTTQRNGSYQEKICWFIFRVKCDYFVTIIVSFLFQGPGYVIFCASGSQ